LVTSPNKKGDREEVNPRSGENWLLNIFQPEKPLEDRTLIWKFF
jgi:hypothetical protein